MMVMFGEKNPERQINDSNRNQSFSKTTGSPYPLFRKEGFCCCPRVRGQGNSTGHVHSTFNPVPPPASALRGGRADQHALTQLPYFPRNVFLKVKSMF